MPFNNSQVHSMVVEHDRSSLAEALLELSDGDEPVVGKGEKASHACTPTTVSLVKLHRHVRAFCGTMHNIDSTAPPQMFTGSPGTKDHHLHAQPRNPAQRVLVEAKQMVQRNGPSLD